MSSWITVLQVQRHTPEEVEHGLTAIFAREERARALRIEGTYSAVLARATDANLAASYAYVILRPHPPADWTPVLEVGNRTEGLDVELSRLLGGCAVFTTFVYGDVVSGYRLARQGAEIDRYASDPSELAGADQDAAEPTGSAEEARAPDAEAWRGHPDSFADLLPLGTTPDEFARVVLRPGWWEESDAAAQAQVAEATDPGDEAEAEDEGEDEDVVDETDRMRCIGLALELWGPSEYPFAQDPEEIANTLAGPAIGVAFA